MQKLRFYFRYWPVVPIVALIGWALGRQGTNKTLIHNYHEVIEGLDKTITQTEIHNRKYKVGIRTKLTAMQTDKTAKRHHLELLRHLAVLKQDVDAEKNFLNWLIRKAEKNKSGQALSPKNLHDLCRRLSSFRKRANNWYLVLGKDPTNPNAKDNPADTAFFPEFMPDFGSNSWEKTMFKQAQPIGQLAALKLLKRQLLEVEKELLETAKRQLVDFGCCFCWTTQYAMPFDFPQSIVAGSSVKSKIWIWEEGKRFSDEFNYRLFNGHSIKYAHNRQFPTSLGDLKEGEFYKPIQYEYDQRVRFTQLNLLPKPINLYEYADFDSTFTVRDSFVLVRPTVIIAPPNGFKLVRGVENAVKIEARELSATNEYRPEIRLKWGVAKFRAANEANTFWIAPETDSVGFYLYNRNGGERVLIGEYKIYVRDPIAPALKATVGGQAFSPLKPLSRSQAVVLVFHDETGTRFQAKAVQLQAQNGRGDFETVKTFSFQPNEPWVLPLKFLPEIASSGAFRIFITDIRRIGANGKNYPVALSDCNRILAGWVE